MDATAIGTLVVAIVGVVIGLFAARTDRTKSLVEAVDQALGWKAERIEALEAEVTGLHNEITALRACLAANGIRPEDCTAYAASITEHRDSP